MKKIFVYIIIGVGTLAGVAIDVFAENITLKPSNSQFVSLEKDSDEKAFLVFFDIPDTLNSKNINIVSAKLFFDACISDGPIGEIEVYPLTTLDWNSIEKYDWTSSKENLDNIYSTTIPGKHVTIKAEDGKKTLHSNVTSILRAWLDDRIDNKGIIVTPSMAFLKDSDIKYSIDLTNAKLVVNYSVE